VKKVESRKKRMGEGENGRGGESSFAKATEDEVGEWEIKMKKII